MIFFSIMQSHLLGTWIVVLTAAVTHINFLQLVIFTQYNKISSEPESLGLFILRAQMLTHKNFSCKSTIETVKPTKCLCRKHVSKKPFEQQPVKRVCKWASTEPTFSMQ